jgi:Zn-finger nucleic acid-binding protein
MAVSQNLRHAKSLRRRWKMSNCPICTGPLTPAEYEGFAVLRCDNCHGHLARSPRVESIKRSKRKSQTELKAEATAEFHGNNPGRVKCPDCHMLMIKQSIKLPVLALQMDVCTNCSLVWFDGGELALAQLGYESRPGLPTAQEMQRRIEELEASPARKAALQKRIARLPELPSNVVGEVFHEITEQTIDAIIRAAVLRLSGSPKILTVTPPGDKT